jgi:hypothetical protein
MFDFVLLAKFRGKINHCIQFSRCKCCHRTFFYTISGLEFQIKVQKCNNFVVEIY